MEVVVPVNPTMDFDFSSSVYASAPATPKLMGCSAPTSPSRAMELYREFEELLIAEDAHRSLNSLAAVPFAWEEKPGVPKSFTQDFAFEVRRNSSVSAEDLFHGGLIKSRNPPPTLQVNKYEMGERERGRERSGLSSQRSRRTRSLPPVIRGLDQAPNTRPPASACTALSTSGSGKGSKKWSFMDLFLFRSASDGRAMDRDPLKKYSAIFRKHDEDMRNSSLRSDRSGSGSGSKRRGRVSAHELHYTVNRAVSNDMKKQTFLPYKQGILGRLAFNPTVHALANGFGISNKD